MQFYKIEGLIDDTKIIEAFRKSGAMNDHYGYTAISTGKEENVLSPRNIINKISRETEDFNEKFKNRSFFFVFKMEIERGGMQTAVITDEGVDIAKEYELYTDRIGIKTSDNRISEITMKKFRTFLKDAERHLLLDNKDSIIETFHLDISGRGFFEQLLYDENIIADTDKKTVYDNAERFNFKDTLNPELDRIYSGKKQKVFYGHPAHYVIQTDDLDLRREIPGTLLQALYQNSRIISKRYIFLNVGGDNEINKDLFEAIYYNAFNCSVIIGVENQKTDDSDLCGGDVDYIESLCKCIKESRNDVLTIICFPKEATKIKEMFYDYLEDICFVELKEEIAIGEKARAILTEYAKERCIKPDKKLFAMIEENESYYSNDLRIIFNKWFDAKIRTSIYPLYTNLAPIKAKPDTTPKGNAYDILQKMVGLSSAKKILDDAVNYYKMQKLFRSRGIVNMKPAMHMIFTGNPGTAKTSFARLFAKILKDNDVVSTGQLVEVGRADLVGKYVGWTSPLVKSAFKRAKGGVLFIDEAYSLVDDRDGSYGDEAINTIVQEMENHREDVVVVFAGYPDKMEKFLDKNPGLRSRIAFHVKFDDYSTPELCDIAKMMVENNQFRLSEDACEKLKTVFDAARTHSDFGNGRYVRNVVERARMAQANRIAKMDVDKISDKMLITITAEDIEDYSEKRPEKNSIGFGM